MSSDWSNAINNIFRVSYKFEKYRILVGIPQDWDTTGYPSTYRFPEGKTSLFAGLTGLTLKQLPSYPQGN